MVPIGHPHHSIRYAEEVGDTSHWKWEVSWFLGFSFSWLLSFLISTHQNSRDWKFRRLENIWNLLEDIWPILLSFHYRFSARYWSDIQDFQKQLQGYSDFLGASFPRIFLFLEIRIWVWDYLKCPGVSRDTKWLVLGILDTPENAHIMKMKVSRSFP